MADISYITLPSGDVYNFKDTDAREFVANLGLDSTYDPSDSEVTLFIRTDLEQGE